ncbi:hypothetical protein LAZ67_12002232 [Cordylochernes scorpioides]|uniref:Reverse transcriptase domain-containing protein n=1 Tax=Cordylochernes scorpioides TaxID=51811 RepID=A0ABY6L2G7_9ARAC|nr:hypothetical protein LAZ67_12002232 [Cordylochernes scorpioides]
MPGHRKRRQFKQTDAFTRGMVIGLKRAGWSIRQIAADTHLGASTVHRLWRRWLEQGNVAIYRNVGATRMTSARVDRRILRQAVAAPQATCTAILQHVQDTLDHSISTRTISRRLVANGLHSCRPLRRLPLTPPNRRQRLEWCLSRSTWMTEWHRVVFSDESRFFLSSDSRRVRVWRQRGERSNPAAIVERPTVRQRGIMGVPNALYQQDNARPHTARISQQALQDVQMLPWPPYSPDLSPIEHVWDIIGRRLHALPQPRSEDELWQMVEREWRAIPQDAIRTLIDSLPRRVAACIALGYLMVMDRGESEEIIDAREGLFNVQMNIRAEGIITRVCFETRYEVQFRRDVTSDSQIYRYDSVSYLVNSCIKRIPERQTFTKVSIKFQFHQFWKLHSRAGRDIMSHFGFIYSLTALDQVKKIGLSIRFRYSKSNSRIIILALLLISGIESNPGPKVTRQTTLETPMEKDLKELIAALSSKMDDWGSKLESRLSGIELGMQKFDTRVQQLESSLELTASAVELNVKKIRELESRISDEIVNSRCRRLSKKDKAPMLVEVPEYSERIKIFKNSFKLRDLKIFVSKDYSPSTREQRRLLIPKWKEFLNKGITAKLRDDKLIVNGTVYRVFNGKITTKEAGDINIRIGNAGGFHNPLKLNSSLNKYRKSKDPISSKLSDKLISFTESNSITIANGRTKGDTNGSFTFISERGSSVLDYFMYTHDLTQIISDMWIEELSYSDHLPTVLQINTGYEAIKSSYNNEILTRKFIWTKKNVEMLIHNLSDIEDGNETDINTKIVNFTTQIYTAMESANIIKFAKRRHQLSKPWYDKDCYIMKKTTKPLEKKPIIQGEIDIKEWFLFYKNLSNKENNEATFTLNQMIGWKDPDLDAEITLEEIYDVVKKLANGKAVGLDGIPNELLKNLPTPTLTKLKNLFNKIMSTEKYPQLWTNSIVHPIYKSGDKNNPTNYRGIALCSNISKLFTTILRNRLNNWIEKREIILENQAGFRKNRSCTDHILLLNSLIQLSLRRKRGKLNVFFVDLTKAFDTVPHDLLWQKLHKMGISNKFVMLIKTFTKKLKLLSDGKGNIQVILKEISLMTKKPIGFCKNIMDIINHCGLSRLNFRLNYDDIQIELPNILKIKIEQLLQQDLAKLSLTKTYSNYRLLYDSFIPEHYFSYNLSSALVSFIAQIRIISTLIKENHIYVIKKEDLYCRLCGSQITDEIYHFTAECGELEGERKKILKSLPRPHLNSLKTIKTVSDKKSWAIELFNYQKSVVNKIALVEERRTGAQ